MTEHSSAPRSLAEEVRDHSWYHTIELPNGAVTDGVFDTPRELRHVPLPESLAGKRCLDVGTMDGFWAFEMERRGAAEVVALDAPGVAALDWPAVVAEQEWEKTQRLDEHRGFRLAKRALDSNVTLVEQRVYDLDPDTIGEFDFAFMGSVLLHVRDPVGALAALRRVVRGELLSVDSISPLLTLLHPRQPIARLEAPGWPLWWLANLAAYRRMFVLSGFEIVASGRPFFVKRGTNYTPTTRTRRPLWGRFQETLVSRLGVPHSWVLARRLPG